MQAKSFDLAAEAYTEAVGGAISGDTLQRITEGWGTQVDQQRNAAAERANAPAQLQTPRRGVCTGETPRTQRVTEIAPLRERANISTDGTMILVRGEGWKEVKLTAM